MPEPPYCQIAQYLKLSKFNINSSGSLIHFIPFVFITISYRASVLLHSYVLLDEDLSNKRAELSAFPSTCFYSEHSKMVELEQNKFEIIVLFLIMNFMLLSFHAQLSGVDTDVLYWKCGFQHYIQDPTTFVLTRASWKDYKCQLEAVQIS